MSWARTSPMSRGKRPMKRGRMKQRAKSLRDADAAARGRIRREALRRQGKKGRKWAKHRRALKPRFERAGITGCEVCGATDNLGFAHSLKRRHITTDELMDEVALLCNTHHDELELQGEAVMTPAIRAIIAARKARTYESA